MVARMPSIGERCCGAMSVREPATDLAEGTVSRHVRASTMLVSVSSSNARDHRIAALRRSAAPTSPIRSNAQATAPTVASGVALAAAAGSAAADALGGGGTLGGGGGTLGGGGGTLGGGGSGGGFCGNSGAGADAAATIAL